MLNITLDNEIGYTDSFYDEHLILLDRSAFEKGDEYLIKVIKKAYAYLPEADAMSSVYAEYHIGESRRGNITAKRKLELLQDIRLVENSILSCGDIKEIAQKLYDWIIDLPEPKKQKVKEVEVKAKDPGGYIYLIQAIPGYYKIGRTRNLDQRLLHFSTKFPAKLELVHYFFMENYKTIESDLHRKYADKRISGEWFDLTSDQVAEICNIGGDS